MTDFYEDGDTAPGRIETSGEGAAGEKDAGDQNRRTAHIPQRDGNR